MIFLKRVNFSAAFGLDLGHLVIKLLHQLLLIYAARNFSSIYLVNQPPLTLSVSSYL